MEKRSPVTFGAYFALTIVTFGIYPLYHWVKATEHAIALLEELVRQGREKS